MSDPYPRYRDSGVEWLGDVPEHWEVRRLKDVGRLIAGAAFPEALQGVEGEAFPFYKVANLDRSVDGRSMIGSDHTISREDAEAIRARVVPSGAIVYAKIGAALLLNRRRVTTAPACIDNNMSAFVPYADTVSTEWALYSMSLLDFRNHVNPGAVPSLSEGDQAILPIPLPPLGEQRAITEFLDRWTKRIDALVEKKRLLIERLQEYRTALITRTVTRGLPPDAARAAGLDPSPRLKPSGVEWLGDVPEHWMSEQLGRIGSFSKGSGGTKEDEVEDGVPCVRYGDLYTVHQFHIKETRANISEESATNYTAIQYGDLLFAGSGETLEEIGKSAANLISGPAYCGGDVILFRPSIEADAIFLGYAADCVPAACQKSCMGRGVTVMHIYSSELKYMLVPLPPLGEQRAIAAFLDRETERIDRLCIGANTVIERLQEHRTALITAAVTGKVDVRDAVPA